MNPDRKAWNSSIRPVAKSKMGKPKKPLVRRKPSFEEVQKRFKAVTAAMLGDKPRKPMKKRAENNEGWYKWAVENVWNKRKSECQVCGLWLLSDEAPSPTFFSHLLPRGSYRRYKLDERNVIIKCADCHEKWHSMGPDKLKDIKDWRLVCDTYFSLRNEANNIADGNERMG